MNDKPAYIDTRIVATKCSQCGDYRELQESGNVNTPLPCGKDNCPHKLLPNYSNKEFQIQNAR